MTTKVFDLDSALRILDLIDNGFDVATATATETPIGELEIVEVEEG